MLRGMFTVEEVGFLGGGWRGESWVGLCVFWPSCMGELF